MTALWWLNCIDLIISGLLTAWIDLICSIFCLPFGRKWSQNSLMNMDGCHLQKLNTRGNDTKLVIICVQMEQNSCVEQTSRKYNFPHIWSNRWGKKHNTVAWLDLYQTFLIKTHEIAEERKQTFQCCYIYKPPTTDVNDKTDQRDPNDDTNNHTTAKELHKNTCKVLPSDYHLRVWAPIGLPGNGT
jgi:hypothetical protein